MVGGSALDVDILASSGELFTFVSLDDRVPFAALPMGRNGALATPVTTDMLAVPAAATRNLANAAHIGSTAATQWLEMVYVGPSGLPHR